MKISQKTIQYILLLLIVLIAAGAYWFGYQGFIEKANSVKNNNKAIEARISELNEKEEHRAEWSEAIDNSQKNIDAILAKYGPGNTPEKSIMFVKGLEDATGVEVSSIAFNPDTVVFTSEDTDENGNPNVEFSTSYISVNYSATYDELKACMDYITKYKERMNVSGFTASPNQESGLLAGNMVINLFGVKDANHKYVDPSVSGISLGTENIFGSGFGDMINTGEIGAETDNVSGIGEIGEGGEGEQPSENGETGTEG